MGYGHAQKDTRQQIWDEESQQRNGCRQHREMEETWHTQGDIGSHYNIQQEITQRPTHYERHHSILGSYRCKTFPTPQPFALRTSQQTYAQQECLLQYQNENGRQDGIAISSCSIINRHFLYLNGMNRQFLIPLRHGTRQGHLYFSIMP